MRPVRVCVGRLIASRPRAGRLSSAGQTKATSSAAVPEASPLSIDPPSAQFLCDLWPCVIPIRVHTEALSRQDNGLVVTEHGDGRASASLPPQVQTHDSSDSENLPVTSARPNPPPTSFQFPSNLPLSTNEFCEGNQKTRSSWFHQYKGKIKKIEFTSLHFIAYSTGFVCTVKNQPHYNGTLNNYLSNIKTNKINTQERKCAHVQHVIPLQRPRTKC